jgi:DNA-binding CsgD family transcriptional regulator
MKINANILGDLEVLYSSRTKIEYARAAIQLAQGVFPSAIIAFHEVSLMSGGPKSHDCSDPRANDHVRVAWSRYAMESPVVKYYKRGGTDPVVRTQELISEVAFKNTGLYAECWRPFGATHQSGIRIWNRSHISGVSIKRDGRFFDDEIRLLLALHPHFLRAYRSLDADIFSAEALGLTPRECEVLHWLAQGKRDGEIAVILGCASKTVSKHVERILGKLLVESRLAAARLVDKWRRGHSQSNHP